MAEWKSNKEKASISELAGDVTTIAFHAKGIELRAGGRSYYAHMQPIATREARCILHASGSSNRFRTPPPRSKRARGQRSSLFGGGPSPEWGQRTTSGRMLPGPGGNSSLSRICIATICANASAKAEKVITSGVCVERKRVQSMISALSLWSRRKRCSG